MSVDLETAIRDLFKPILREVIEEALNRRPLSVSQTPARNETEDQRLLLRAREAAKRLAISERHLHKLTAEGVLPCVRVGHLVHYSVETIEQWIRDTESTSPPTPKARPTKKEPSDPTPPSAQKSKTRRKKSPTKPVKSSPRSEPQKQRRQVARQQLTKEEQTETEHPNQFRLLLKEIGIDRDDLGPLTNGELRQIAEVDVPVFHGWMCLGRAMPEEALERLRQHFGKMSR